MFVLKFDLVGRRVVEVRRMLYPDPLDQTIDPTDGDVELVFDDGRVAHFDVYHGETVCLTDEAWVDPFVPPLSPENAQYIERCGWELTYASGRQPQAHAY